MWAMEKLKYYLLGHVFHWRTNHKPLEAMMKNKLNALLEGWIDTIMCFEFIPEYLPGSNNSFADALSRCYDNTSSVNDHSNTMSSIKVVHLDTQSTLAWEAEKRGKIIP